MRIYLCLWWRFLLSLTWLAHFLSLLSINSFSTSLFIFLSQDYFHEPHTSFFNESQDFSTPFSFTPSVHTHTRIRQDCPRLYPYATHLSITLLKTPCHSSLSFPLFSANISNYFLILLPTYNHHILLFLFSLSYRGQFWSFGPCKLQGTLHYNKSHE